MKDKGSLLATMFALGFMIPAMIWSASLNRVVEEIQKEREALKVTREYTLDELLDAIEFVESGGEEFPESCTGDGGDAVGCYQIHKIYVDDANRIVGWDKFSYADRWDREKSREMTSIVIQHYGKGDFETMARTHKCPPERYKESTKAYWQKVKAVLK